jgi:hypothetical protein
VIILYLIIWEYSYIYIGSLYKKTKFSDEKEADYAISEGFDALLNQIGEIKNDK